MIVCYVTLATPFTELRRIPRVVEEISPRIYPRDAARQNLGVLEERLERRLGGHGTYCVWPRRVLDRVVGYDERAAPARRLVRRRAVEEIRVREQDVSGPHFGVDQGKSLHRFPQRLFVDAGLFTGYAVRQTTEPMRAAQELHAAILESVIVHS